jgi:hypothetical protein
METGQANVFGDDLEPATVNDEMGDNFSFRKRQHSATQPPTLVLGSSAIQRSSLV